MYVVLHYLTAWNQYLSYVHTGDMLLACLFNLTAAVQKV